MKWTRFEEQKPPDSTVLLVIFGDEGCLLGFFKDKIFHSLQQKEPNSFPEFWRILDTPLTIKQNPLKKVYLIFFFLFLSPLSAMQPDLTHDVLQARELHLYTARILLLPKFPRDFIILFIKNLVMTAEGELDGKEESVS